VAGDHVQRALAAVCFVVLAGSARADMAEQVLESLQAARRQAGVEPLVRRADLDAVARSRAERVAALPHRDRLNAAGPISDDLRQAGIDFRRVSLHLDLNRGYVDPAQAFVETWSAYESSWASALSGDFDGVGGATARADDGWIVLAVVLLEGQTFRPDPIPDELEARIVTAINEVRLSRGRVALEVDPVLVDAARSHSRDMVRRRYFDHVAPDGVDLQERIRRRGLDYGRVGENLHKNSGVADPVATAVQSWMESPGHRKLLLATGFRRTGVGVALDGTGTVYFTQVFLAPPAGSGAGRAE
jgi:uncharacterized protein YkwD